MGITDTVVEPKAFRWTKSWAKSTHFTFSTIYLPKINLNHLISGSFLRGFPPKFCMKFISLYYARCQKQCLVDIWNLQPFYQFQITSYGNHNIPHFSANWWCSLHITVSSPFTIAVIFMIRLKLKSGKTSDDIKHQSENTHMRTHTHTEIYMYFCYC
jgi:hypothetical protein